MPLAISMVNLPLIPQFLMAYNTDDNEVASPLPDGSTLTTPVIVPEHAIVDIVNVSSNVVESYTPLGEDTHAVSS